MSKANDSKQTTRRFELIDEKSSKFWEISLAGDKFTVRYGKIGTDGQIQEKQFADASTAEKQHEKLITEKVGKGYVAVGASQSTQPVTGEDQEIKKTVSKGSSKGKDPAVAKRTPIARAPKVVKHNELMLKLKEDVLAYLAANKALSKDGFSKESSTAARLKAAFAFFEESFVFERKVLAASKIDRCASMLCGPFFTSSKYPQPSKNDQLHIPVAQLDTGWINECCDSKLAEGLLQVWYGPDGSSVVRMIPAQDISQEVLTPFSTNDAMISECAVWIPENWGGLHTESISQLTGLLSIGVTSPGLTNFCNCDYEDHEDLMTLLEDIEDARYGVEMNKKNIVEGVKLFGGFSPYQTSVTDYIDAKLVVDVSGFCGAGVAHLLSYKSGKWQFVVTTR